MYLPVDSRCIKMLPSAEALTAKSSSGQVARQVTASLCPKRMCLGWTFRGNHEEVDLPLPLVPLCRPAASQMITVVSLLPVAPRHDFSTQKDYGSEKKIQDSLRT